MSLSVIIPSKTPSNLEPCVAAIRHNDPNAHAVVIDDGLPREWLDANLGLDVMRGKRPFVYARNCNIGIENTGYDDVILLNDDALLQTPGGFTAMQQLATERPEYGLIASTCNNTGNPRQWPSGGSGLRDEPRQVCFICVLIPRRTIDLVGLLDERFVGYGYEDDDYSVRVRRAGLKIGIFDGCYVDHGSLRSTFRGNPTTPANLEPNHSIFVQKWGSVAV